jgi:hypothetical protein
VSTAAKLFMTIAKTLSDKILIFISFGVVAGIAAYGGGQVASHRAENRAEALSATWNVTAASQLVAIADILRIQNPALAQRRAVEMANNHLSFYNRCKTNPNILKETHESAKKLADKLAAGQEVP